MAASRAAVVILVILLVLLLTWAVVVTVFYVRELQSNSTDGSKDTLESLHLIDREVTWRHQPGPCKNIPGADAGSEDLTILQNGIMLVTSGFFPKDKGRILLVDLKETNPAAAELPIDHGDNFNPSAFHPHGFTAWVDPNTGNVTLLVVTHPETEDKVEVFTFDQRSLRLKHIRTITDPAFTFMNNLVAMDKDKFYITKFYESARDGEKQALEITEKQNKGQILYYDGTKAKVVSDEYFYQSNGINASPDKQFIYMAEFGAGNVWVFKRNTATHMLEVVEKKHVGSGVDNIEVNAITGDMWIGSHPVMATLLDYFYNFGKDRFSPSQTLRIKVGARGNITDVIEVFLDDGHMMSGSTCASYYEGKMVSGSINRELIVCEANCID